MIERGGMRQRNMPLQWGDIVTPSFTNSTAAASTEDASTSLPDAQHHEDILLSSNRRDIGTTLERFSEEEDGEIGKLSIEKDRSATPFNALKVIIKDVECPWLEQQVQFHSFMMYLQKTEEESQQVKVEKKISIKVNGELQLRVADGCAISSAKSK